MSSNVIKDKSEVGSVVHAFGKNIQHFSDGSVCDSLDVKKNEDYYCQITLNIRI